MPTWLWKRPGLSVAVILALLLIPVSLLGHLRTDHSAGVFLAADDPAVVLQKQVDATFGIQRSVILLMQGPPLTDERLASLTGLGTALGRISGVSRVVHALDRLPARSDLLDQLERHSPLAQVVHLSRHTEGAYAYLLLVDAHTRAERGAVLAAIEEAVQDHAPPESRSSVAGLDVLDHEMEVAMAEVQGRLIPGLLVVMALFLWLLYRNGASVAAILLCVGAAELVAMEVFAAFGQPMNLLTILLPVLQLSLSTALALHVVTHVRVALGNGLDRTAAVKHAVSTQWRPCFWTALTTAIGFGSLATSGILPLRVLGLAMAAAIFAALILGFTLLPALLLVLRANPREGLQPGRWLRRFVPGLVHRRTLWIGSAAGLLLAGAFALPGLRTETNGLHYFSAQHPMRQDTEEIQRQVTGTSSLHVVVRPVAGVGQAAALDAVHRELDQVPGTRGVLSLKTLAEQEFFRVGLAGAPGPAPTALAESMAPFQNAGELRVTVLVDTMGTEQYRPVKETLDQSLERLRGTGLFERVVLAGDFPIIMQVQDELMATLFRSLGLTFLAILVLILLIHRRVAWMAALTPALLLPLAAAAAACRLFDIPLTIGTVMVFSVTLGIAVDDAIHVLHSAAQGQSLERMLSEVGEALFATSMVIALGFLVLGASPFLPTRQFGLITALSMLVALAANLVLLPGSLRARPSP